MACPILLKLLLVIVENGIDTYNPLLGLRSIGLSKLDLSIIIVNYRSWDVLQECLDSLNQYSPKLSYEVIVVDNDSQDGRITSFSKSTLPLILLRTVVITASQMDAILVQKMQLENIYYS